MIPTNVITNKGLTILYKCSDNWLITIIYNISSLKLLCM